MTLIFSIFTLNLSWVANLPSWKQIRFAVNKTIYIRFQNWYRLSTEKTALAKAQRKNH